MKEISPMQWFKIAVVVFIGAIIIVWYQSYNSNFSIVSDFRNASTASLLINFGNSNERMFQGNVRPKMTVLDALYSSSLNGNFKLRYAIDSRGDVNIYTLNDEINNTYVKKWRFYVNDQIVPSRRIGATIIKPGDKILARFE